MNIKQTIEKVTAIRDELQAAIADGEHVLEVVEKNGTKTELPTGQLVNAAGAAQALIRNLEGHLLKVAEVEEQNKKTGEPEPK